jgi:hypothetical protein
LEINMAQAKGMAASEGPYDAITLAKKHRISVEDAQQIIDQYGTDRKSADKAARRIAA